MEELHPEVRRAMAIFRSVKDNDPDPPPPVGSRERIKAMSLDWISRHEEEMARARQRLNEWAQDVARWRQNGVKFASVPTARPTVGEIVKEVCRYYNVTRNDFESIRRPKWLVRCRFIVYYLADKLTRNSLPQIGLRVCRDHTSIIHGRNKIKKRMLTDDILRQQVEELERIIMDKFEAEQQSQFETQTDSGEVIIA